MSDVTYLGKKWASLDVSSKFDAYTKVIINIDDDTQVSAGVDGGRVLEVDNPLGTQEIANEMLARLQNYRYQPYRADGALLDPASEIGDAVDTPSVWGGIYTRSRTFGRLMRANISAPHDEEINHEYQFESPSERKFRREMGDVHASLKLQSNLIATEVEERKAQGDLLSSKIEQTSSSILAEVVQQTGGMQSSFSWELTSDAHKWYANGQKVMEISASGLVVSGEVKATSGKIGGFTIGEYALQYKGLNWGDRNKNEGIYIGTSGIQLGKNFWVSPSGEVTAKKLTLDSLVIGGKTISASDLKDDAESGASAYSWTSSNGSYTVSGASYGYSYNKATNRYSGEYPSFFRTNNLSVNGYGFVRGTPYVLNGITHYPWEYQSD